MSSDAAEVSPPRVIIGSSTVVVVEFIVVVVPFTVRFPAMATFAPVIVIAVVGVVPDFMTSSFELSTKAPNVAPFFFRVASPPPRSRIISPGASIVKLVAPL